MADDPPSLPSPSSSASGKAAPPPRRRRLMGRLRGAREKGVRHVDLLEVLRVLWPGGAMRLRQDRFCKNKDLVPVIGSLGVGSKRLSGLEAGKRLERV